MRLTDIVTFWSALRQPNEQGQWVHPADEHLLRTGKHTFNLDFPVSPYVGDILNAPVIVLGLNAGYSESMTPREFPNANVIAQYLEQVASPEISSWALISDYYKSSNSWPFMERRQIAWINASPYRSPSLSTERENQRLAAELPSTKFHNQWMAQAVMPLARAGTRLVAVKRKSLWTFLLPQTEDGISACKSFVGKHLDASVVDRIEQFTQNRT